MDTSKIKTLQQVLPAIAAVDDARKQAKRNRAITPDQKDALDDTAVLLRKIQDDIILQSEQALIDALTADCTDLNNLIAKINAAVADLAKVAGILQKVSTAVNGLVTVAATVVKAGLI